jgi:hypothetical protein
MSPREKKLLILFGVAGFIILNFLAFGFLKSKSLEVERKRGEARRKLDTAQLFMNSREQVADQMEWLAEHEPKPAANQDVQTSLQQLGEKEARATGLTIKSQKPLPTEMGEGHNYHRAKIQFTVNGPEDALYKWFDKLNSPEQFRIASSIKISPNSQDDTKIDCIATIEQYFVPLPPST